MAATKARRGDLVVLEKRTSYTTTSEGYHEATVYDVGIVASITRDGIVKAVETRYGGSTPLKNMHGIGRTFVVPQGEINVREAAEAAWSNEWRPGYPGKPFDSLDDLRDVVRPFLVGAVAA